MDIRYGFCLVLFLFACESPFSGFIISGACVLMVISSSCCLNNGRSVVSWQSSLFMLFYFFALAFSFLFSFCWSEKKIGRFQFETI